MTTQETVHLTRADALMKRVMSAPKSSRIGLIIGDPGTGKSSAGEWLARKYDGLRLAGYRGMRRADFTRELALLSGQTFPQSTALVPICKEIVRGRLLVIDEADKLQLGPLEMARFFADECNAAVLLIGTPLLERYFRNPSVKPYVQQLLSRIGTKRLEFTGLSTAEVAEHVLIPRFGTVSKELATLFNSRIAGNWRLADGLAEGCATIIRANRLDGLSMEVVDAAIAALTDNELFEIAMA